jgi:urocanate hydratase
MSKARYNKIDIAKLQLMTSVALFLHEMDHSSVITLAGAAGTILERLVRNEGKEPFVDFASKVHRELIGYMPKRRSYTHHINTILGINAHKHMSEEDSETIDLDLEKLAVDALTKAVVDYIRLFGQEEPFIKAFLSWTWKNMDGPTIMDNFKKLPKKLKNL